MWIQKNRWNKSDMQKSVDEPSLPPSILISLHFVIQTKKHLIRFQCVSHCVLVFFLFSRIVSTSSNQKEQQSHSWNFDEMNSNTLTSNSNEKKDFSFVRSLKFQKLTNKLKRGDVKKIQSVNSFNWNCFDHIESYLNNLFQMLRPDNNLHSTWVDFKVIISNKKIDV